MRTNHNQNKEKPTLKRGMINFPDDIIINLSMENFFGSKIDFSPNVYSQGLQTLDYVRRSVPEGEYREFCQSCLLTGMQEPVVLRRTVWARTKKRHSKWEVKLTKSVFVLL